MSQHDRSPHSRPAIVADLACIIGEIAVLQDRQAALSTATAAVQGRLAEMVRSLCQTAVTLPPLGEEDRRRLEKIIKDSPPGLIERAPRAAPATQAASPSGHPPVGQDEGQPENARKAPDARSERVPGVSASDQSGEFVTRAGAEGESAASADTAPVADAKPIQPAAKAEKRIEVPVEPVVPRREPQVLRAGGGLVQDGGSAKPKTRGDEVLDLWAETTLTQNEIAARLKINSGTSSAYLSTARRAQDPRALKGDAARGLPATTAGESTDVRKVADPIPEDAVVTVLGDQMVHGPAGSWKADPKVAKAVGLLADGALYGIDRLADASGLKDSTVTASLGVWGAALAKIGVDLVHTKGIGVKLNRRQVA